MKPAVVRSVAFLVTFLGVGLPFWQMPYSQASLPGYAIAITFAVSAALRALARDSFRPAFLVVGLAVPAAVLARVAFETGKDPTSHNLWPFEIIMAVGFGFAGSLPGALVGGLLASARRRGPAGDRRT